MLKPVELIEDDDLLNEYPDRTPTRVTVSKESHLSAEIRTSFIELHHEIETMLRDIVANASAK